MTEDKLIIIREDGTIHKTTPLKTWRQRCKCECETNGPCEHNFNGPVVYAKNSGSVTCIYCGLDAMSHDTKFM